MTDQLPLVRLVDDDEIFLMSQKLLLETRGFAVQTYASADDFLQKDVLTRPGCVVADVRMPGLTGLDMQAILEGRHSSLPLIFLTGHGDVSMAVHTMRHGAADFLEKPVKPEVLIAVVTRAVQASVASHKLAQGVAAIQSRYDELTPREREVVKLAALDTPNKVIARELGIAEPTVKMHRAGAFAKLGVKSVLEAYRLLEELGLIAKTDEKR